MDVIVGLGCSDLLALAVGSAVAEGVTDGDGAGEVEEEADGVGVAVELGEGVGEGDGEAAMQLVVSKLHEISHERVPDANPSLTQVAPLRSDPSQSSAGSSTTASPQILTLAEPVIPTLEDAHALLASTVSINTATISFIHVFS